VRGDARIPISTPGVADRGTGRLRVRPPQPSAL